MKNSTYSFIAILIIVLALTALGVILYQGLFVGPVDAEISPPLGLSVVLSSSSTLPVRLQIPKLSIDAKVQKVGITKKDTMGIPSNFTDVGWYKYGPVPGAMGNAVIDGHVDNAVNLSGVFKRLDTLKPGDKLSVVNAGGEVSHFVVTRKEIWDYDATTTGELFGSATTSNLILVTCGGDWDQAIKEYLKRVVIFSMLVR